MIHLFIYFIFGIFVGHVLTVTVMFICGMFVFRPDDAIKLKISLPFELPIKDKYDAYIPNKDIEKIFEGLPETN